MKTRPAPYARPVPPMPSNWDVGFGPDMHFSIPTGEVPYVKDGIWYLSVIMNSTGQRGEYNFRTDITEGI